ncbi:glycosyltransferase family 25 protein [Halenospora varia]|nr:glycosyltransferase family 25 protein [Halenospora varia]
MLAQLSRNKPSKVVAISVSAAVLLLLLVFRISRTDAASNFMSGSKGRTTPKGRMNETLGFQEIFVVNLPERTDRRDGMILATALSGLKIEFIDAVLGKNVLDKALPPGGRKGMPDPNIGSWRGHMNAIAEVVRRNLSSALILEDDSDWDIRIKEQLFDFSLAAQALTQPLSADPSTYADSTYPKPKNGPEELPKAPILFEDLPQTIKPLDSPYGDDWDLLWVGHCGMRFPGAGSPGDPAKLPKGRVLRSNDVTVPEKQYLQTSAAFDIKAQYPSHTRAYHHVSDGICSLGYAISQKGARSLLYYLGMLEFTHAFDVMLQQYCVDLAGKGYHKCLTVTPSVFEHHRPAGNMTYESDISGHGDQIREHASTDNVRWSVRLNVKQLLEGSDNMVDQFPDTEPAGEPEKPKGSR